jgi:hypothetical protein
MLKMNLITQKELCGGFNRKMNRELWREFYREVYGKLRREVNWPLGSQIRADFSHSKISRV